MCLPSRLAGRRPALVTVRLNANRFRLEDSETATACAAPVIGNMMQLRVAGSWAHQNRRIRSPRLDGTIGSIELGIFDESERGRTKVSQARSRVRTARPSWPLSARLLVGAMFVLNILLAAFLVRTEIKRPEAKPGPPATSTPLSRHRPKADSTPQPNAPPDQGSSLDQGTSHGVKTPAVEARPAALPRTQMAKRTRTKAPRASKTPRAVLSAPMPRAVIDPTPEPLGRTPAPVRNPAASSSASADVPPPGRAAPFGIPGAGVPSNAGTPSNAPAASALAPSALAPSAIDYGLTAKGTRSGSVAKVASVGLPPMEKGLVTPKMAVAPVSPKMEIIPRPAVKVENCGDDKVFIACPTLKMRYDTPYTSEAR